MQTKRRSAVLRLVRLVGLLVAFLSATPALAQTQQAAHIFAASSLTDALNELAPLYVATGHPQPVFNYAASSTLARQIEQGAGADVFVSADEAWMDYLAQRQMIDPATRVSLLSNRLVLIAPTDHPLHLQIRNGFDLVGALNGGKLAMGDPDSVPAGRYGRAALQSLGVWDQVNAAVVRAENVRAALRFVEVGEAAAGIVYYTDALASGDRVQIVGEFPATSHPPISYPLAVTHNGNAEGRAFAAFLRTDTAKAVFLRLGFSVQ